MAKGERLLMGQKMQFFTKANINALAGLPISMALNVTILPPLMDFMHVNPYWGVLLVSVPYYIASVKRQFIIDYVLWRWKINIDPAYHIKKILTRGKTK